MAKNKNKKRGFSIYWLFGKIGDILFIPIILVSLFSSMSMLIQRNQNKPTSIFGYSLVNILSKSMENSGFKKGDTVITKNSAISTVELGDVIAFYNYRDSKDSSTIKHVVMRYNYEEGNLAVDFSEDNIEIGVAIDSIEHKERENEKTVKDAQTAKATIYFHQVIGIYLDDYGNVFYKTKGSNNSYSDNYVRSDFVVGEYVKTPRFLRDAMTFCSSSTGMIILVCLPLSILVLMQCFSLIKQVETINTEKQLLTGRKRFNDEEVKKSFNGNEMETYNKVLLYYYTAKNEREQVVNFMWSELLEKENLSKKEEILVNTMKTANEKLDISGKDYWQVWIENTKGHTSKKIKKYYEEVAVNSILSKTKNENSNLNFENVSPNLDNATNIEQNSIITKKSSNDSYKQEMENIVSSAIKTSSKGKDALSASKSIEPQKTIETEDFQKDKLTTTKNKSPKTRAIPKTVSTSSINKTDNDRTIKGENINNKASSIKTKAGTNVKDGKTSVVAQKRKVPLKK